MKKLLIGLFSLCMISTAQAGSLVIAGEYTDLENIQYSRGAGNPERDRIDLTGGKVRIGWKFGDNFLIEGSYGQTEDVIGTEAGRDLDRDGDVDSGRYRFEQSGIYMRAFTEVYPRVRIQGVFGHTWARQIFTEDNDDPDDELMEFNKSGWSYGVGIAVRIFEFMHVTLDWMQLLDFDRAQSTPPVFANGENTSGNFGDRFRGINYGVQFEIPIGGDD